MKKLILFIGILSLWACSTDKLDTEKGKAAVETLIRKIDKEQYKGLSDLYSDDFNAGESLEVRSEKFKKLKQAMGEVQSLDLTEAKNEAVPGDECRLTLTYKIKRSRISSVETFVVILEDGKYKVFDHSIRSDN